MSGEAQYTDDVSLPPNTLHAAFVTSTKPHAKLLGVDASAAVAMPGWCLLVLFCSRCTVAECVTTQSPLFVRLWTLVYLPCALCCMCCMCCLCSESALGMLLCRVVDLCLLVFTILVLVAVALLLLLPNTMYRCAGLLWC